MKANYQPGFKWWLWKTKVL